MEKRIQWKIVADDLELSTMDWAAAKKKEEEEKLCFFGDYI